MLNHNYGYVNVKRLSPLGSREKVKVLLSKRERSCSKTRRDIVYLIPSVEKGYGMIPGVLA